MKVIQVGKKTDGGLVFGEAPVSRKGEGKTMRLLITTAMAVAAFATDPSAGEGELETSLVEDDAAVDNVELSYREHETQLVVESDCDVIFPLEAQSSELQSESTGLGDLYFTVLHTASGSYRLPAAVSLDDFEQLDALCLTPWSAQ